MPQDIFTTVALSKDAQNVNEALAHIQSACQTIQAAAGRLNQISESWNDKRNKGTISAEDVAALNTRTQGLSELLSAVDAYLRGR